MKILSRDKFDEVKESIMKYGRPLEKSLFKNHFEGNDAKTVVYELKRYQNLDGGFAHGIESDFRLPDSSPMATSVGIRLLSEVDSLEEARYMIEAAIGYLEKSFDRDRNGWFAVPKEVNQHPHAPWWHYNEDDGMTIIDRNWGNPSAEIVAYLYRYKEYVKALDVEQLTEYAISHMENTEEFDSENEIFCYIKLYEVLPPHLQKRLEKVLPDAIDQMIMYDAERWNEYVPTPVDFVRSDDTSRFGVPQSEIDENLDFVVDKLNHEGKILPPWGDSFYQSELKQAYNEWIGVLSLNALTTLDSFGRIEK